jgi:hypothetical protein
VVQGISSLLERGHVELATFVIQALESFVRDLHYSEESKGCGNTPARAGMYQNM